MKHALRTNITTYKVVITHGLYELNIIYRALLHSDYTSQEDMAYILLKSMRCDWVETLPDIIQSLPQLTMFATALHWFLLLVGWDSKKRRDTIGICPTPCSLTANHHPSPLPVTNHWPLPDWRFQGFYAGSLRCFAKVEPFPWTRNKCVIIVRSYHHHLKY